MEEGSNRGVLLLNADYRPKDVIHWQAAISIVFRERVFVLAVYEDWVIRSPSLEMRVPAVLLLKRYVRWETRLKFNRRNVFKRDKYACQYCGKSAERREIPYEALTYDHVQPRSRGGKTTWENIVTACYPCNHKKADLSLEEAGMKPMTKPRKPKDRNDIEFCLRGRRIPEIWGDFLSET